MKAEIVTEWKTFDEFPNAIYQVREYDGDWKNAGDLAGLMRRSNLDVRKLIIGGRLRRIIEEEPIPEVRYVDMAHDSKANNGLVRVKKSSVEKMEEHGWYRVKAVLDE